MRLVGVGVVLLLLAVSVHAAFSTEQLKNAAIEAGKIPQVQPLLGSNALVLLKAGNDQAFVSWDGASFSNANPGNPDFTIAASSSAMRALTNAEDKGRELKCLLSKNGIVISAADLAKQAAIKAGSAAMANCPERVWFYSPKQEFYLNEAKNFGLFFARKPGILARSPGLIYATVSKSPNAVGPWNIFKINPGLKGPNDILRLNPGLIGPADMAILNPNLHGPAEFAHMMGIGAHSNSVRHLANQGVLDLGRFDPLNRWGNRR